ncbi:hypothetical protein [Pedobacter endophyticus]|uniref:Uncharacterized protein n=1 Tax=Pedobacter endophyticus TaxID=2789740 RepID=A0A7U3SPB9_9SPHI|nr:hypothetical protein [Pedobacter endophyticus]QPH37896.1 hypothetical protein IZT61_12335 [Pedobacter endophyticus]
MKNFESANQETELRNEPQRPVLKNYKLARRALPLEKAINEGMEYMYHDLLKRIKKMYSTLPNEADRLVVEIDCKNDPFDPDGLWCFFTPHLYYHVRCNYVERYEVDYQFHNCPFENEIRAWFKRVLHPMYTNEVSKKPDYPTFYQRVLAYQPKERIYTLDYCKI